MKTYRIPVLITAPDEEAAKNAEQDVTACIRVVELAVKGRVTATAGPMVPVDVVSEELTGEKIAEALRRAGIEVQYFPFDLKAENRTPHTCGSFDLNKVADALNAYLKGTAE